MWQQDLALDRRDRVGVASDDSGLSTVDSAEIRHHFIDHMLRELDEYWVGVKVVGEGD